MKPETEVWVGVAEIDHRTAHRTIDGGDPIPESACFHAHQCIEKYLKALLEEANRPVPRTHDLGVVLRLAGDLVPELAPHAGAIETMVPYAVELRYWGAAGVLGDVVEETASAMATMDAVRGIARGALGFPDEDES